MKEVGLTDLIDVSVLQQIQDGFSKYTGMAALTTDASGVPVTVGSGFTHFCMNLTRQSELGNTRCKACDRDGALMTLEKGRSAAYDCHAGLVDFAAPIMVNGKVIGSFIGGQVRTREVDEESMAQTARELGIDPDTYINAAKQTLCLPMDDVRKAATFLEEIASSLSEMAYWNYKALQHSRKLESAARSQSEFIMNLSMKMEQNMKEWLLLAEEAIDSGDADLIRLALSKVHQRGRETYSNIQDAVEYIRISAGEVELSETEYRVEDLRQQIQDSLESMTEGTAIDITVTTEEQIPEYLLGDAGRIGQIVSKLVLNLTEEKKTGNIQITLSTQNASYATVLLITIVDAPTGLESVEIQEMQKYFDKSSLSLDHQEVISGYGLSLVKVLLGQMSGKIEVTQEQEQAEIQIRLPQLQIEGEEKHGV